MSLIRFVKTAPNPPKINQSRIQRDWMDETYKKHAYQCLPMTAANVHGWEICMEEDLTFVWDGGNTPPRILGGEFSSSGRMQANASIVGMISINMGWVIRTEEPLWTWMSGPPNYFKDGVVPLSATLPSWWWPDEVQMNWKLTIPNQEITFKAGEPFCFFNVFNPEVLGECDIRIENLWDDMELSKQRQKYGQLKMETLQNQPWTWTKGIRTGLDADGNRIGPATTGMLKLPSPEC